MVEIFTLITQHPEGISAALTILLLAIVDILAYVVIKKMHNEIMK